MISSTAPVAINVMNVVSIGIAGEGGVGMSDIIGIIDVGIVCCGRFGRR